MTYVIKDLNAEKLLEMFMEKNLKKQIKKNLKLKKKIKKENKLYVKWKGYDNSFNSGIVVMKLIVGLNSSSYTKKVNLKKGNRS